MVAYGTGAPELVISLQALVRGETDITVGNVIGSNLFNILPTLGLAALITPLIVHAQLVRLDVPLLIIVTGIFWLFSADLTLDRYESLFFVLALVTYSAWVVWKSRQETTAVQKEYADEFEAVIEKPSKWWHHLGYLLVGLGMLVGGAQLFLDHAVAIAEMFEISPLIIGLTLVAGGTSLPELATTVMAAYRGERDIAVGNAIGSSLFNVLGVLGISGLVAPGGLPVSLEARDFDIPIMFAVSVACLPVFFIRPRIARWQGAVFFAYYVAYIADLILEAVHSEHTRTFESVMMYFFIPLTGMAIAVGVIRRLLYRSKEETDADSGQPS